MAKKQIEIKQWEIDTIQRRRFVVLVEGRDAEEAQRNYDEGNHLYEVDVDTLDVEQRGDPRCCD